MLTSIILSMAMSVSPATLTETKNLEIDNIKGNSIGVHVDQRRKDIRIDQRRKDIRIDQRRKDIRIGQRRKDIRI